MTAEVTATEAPAAPMEPQQAHFPIEWDHTPIDSETSSHSEKTPDVEKGEQSPDSASQASDKDEQTRTIHGFRWFLVCASIYIAAFTYGLDTTIAAEVQSPVVETFGNVQQLSWLGSGFLLGAVATILPVGNLFERFDIKWNFLAGVILFELGSAICGAAPSLNALIVGRVIAGIGGSGVYIGALSFFSSLTTEKERGLFISLTGAAWGVGCVVGPVIGGAFSESSATWRWAFYINLIIAAVCAPVYLTMPSYEPMHGVSRMSRLLSLDWVGSVLYAGVWVIFTVLFSFAGSQWAWDDRRVIALFVVLAVLLVAFVTQQGFAFGTSKANRLFPTHLLFSRTQVLLAVGTAASTTALFIPIYYIPLYFQFVHGDTPISAAVRLLPFLVLSMGVNLAIGNYVSYIPYYAALYLVGGVFIIAGAAPLYVLLTPETPVSYVYGFTVLIGIGAGMAIQVGYTLASVKASHQGRPQDMPHTIALQNVAQIGGGAIALIISGQVFQTYAFRNLSAVLTGFSDADISSAVAGAQSAVFREIDAETAARATLALTGAMSNVWILVLTSGATMVALSAGLRWEKLF